MANVVEIDRRPSGVWTVLYQHGLPGGLVNTYQRMFDLLGTDLIYEETFARVRARNMACFLATKAYAEGANILLERLGFKADNEVSMLFHGAVDPLSTGTPQSGQVALRIVQRGVRTPFALLDPTCYLYGISHKDMPITVGEPEFIERAMSEVYSNLTQSQLNITLFPQL